ncbi:hypothetical protein ETD86_29580 [Nonomuraea turkmeniaca]|uniref:Chromosome segregation ATPase n=1 Tax=Nonomuraea turkmeniaca TaxID=103838 RepID=A0A5S4FAJ0_9ACTN|nr:hypothetical protein [Nonomuraea turkmeniaca]TMR14099.1 hypothetical protein ETD86_29580 [Nonomuraea turkmeniaca]
MTMDPGDHSPSSTDGPDDLDEVLTERGREDDADRERPGECPCGNKLRPPARRADGSRHGGRPSKYCSAACRSRFRTGRRKAQQQEVAEATRRALALGEQYLPALEQTQELGAELRELLRAITVTQAQMLKDAEEDAEEAIATAEQQEAIAAVAEVARGRAQEQAEEERRRRTTAVRTQHEAEARAAEAKERADQADERAREAAERADAALEKEREARREAKEEGEARVKADAAAEVARRERDTAVEERKAAEQREAALRTQCDNQAAQLSTLTEHLRAARGEVAELKRQKETETERAASAERRAEQAQADAREARQETKTVREELRDVRAELKDVRGSLATAERDAGEAATALAVAQTKLAEAQDRQRDLERRLATAEQKEQPERTTDTEAPDRQ